MKVITTLLGLCEIQDNAYKTHMLSMINKTYLGTLGRGWQKINGSIE